MTNKLIENINTENYVKAQKDFSQLMAEKVSIAIQDLKTEVVQGLFSEACDDCEAEDENDLESLEELSPETLKNYKTKAKAGDKDRKAGVNKANKQLRTKDPDMAYLQRRYKKLIGRDAPLGASADSLRTAIDNASEDARRKKQGKAPKMRRDA